jgi:hypothetical protein
VKSLFLLDFTHKLRELCKEFHMLHTIGKQPLRIKSALVAAFFVAAQLSMGLAGGKVFAAELPEQANEHANSSLAENKKETPGNQNENANEEDGPTNSVAVEASENANNGNENTPESGPPAEVVEHLTELSETKNENVGNGVLNNPAQQQTQQEEEEEDEPETVVMVTLCHATGSVSHPFEEITIANAAAFNGHLGSGNGDHQNAEDIIPPFTYKGQVYSQNWDAAGQATHHNNCVAPTVPEEEPEDIKVTLCHATHSLGNPFVTINVAAAAAYNGHLGDGNGDHQEGEDIIPPFTYKGQVYSQNWDAAGQATYNNGCVAPTGGQGGDDDGDILGATTSSDNGQILGAQLVNTGTNALMSIIVSLTILGLTAGAHFLSRKQYA